MAVHKRLKEFILTCYTSQINFAEEMNLSKSCIARYVSGLVKPDGKCLIKMHEKGLSINWLFSGTGSMFADNETGKKLKFNYYKSNKIFLENLNSKRIKYWIETNYNSLEHYSACTSYPLADLEQSLEENNVIDPIILRVLEITGCNSKWIFDDNESMYNDNVMGIKLSNRNNNNNSIENLSILSEKFTLEEIMNYFLMLDKLLDLNNNGNNK